MVSKPAADKNSTHCCKDRGGPFRGPLRSQKTLESSDNNGYKTRPVPKFINDESPSSSDVRSQVEQLNLKPVSSGEEETKSVEDTPAGRAERRLKLDLKLQLQELTRFRLLVDNDAGLGLVTRSVPGKGRGVFAARDFYKGDFIVEYAGDLISGKMAKEKEAEYEKDPSKGCFMFYFKANEKPFCIDATEESGRLGRLVNHSKLGPNSLPKVVTIRSTPRLVLVANRNIKAGEEILINYGDKSYESLQSHPWLAL